ncbi:hypothetical protein WICPIJ_004819 [Wickerhamomyces pijperi]|uniref:Uncharacterized protein n=1 Tax=Wickerhamomyces pijperi TaxID=599730 RepID=A0A9P8Q513_WICPI|nr:hypothetical protein WICPIJ_004819 [Wickerhamomyces pijperi]
MSSRSQAYSSLFQIKVVKLIYLLNSFLFFAIGSRTLLLLNLIGLFQYIANGVHDFYCKSVLFITFSELALSLLGLIPIRFNKLVFNRCLDLHMIYLFHTFYEQLTKNQVYSLYLVAFSLYDLLEYINHYYGLFKIGKFKTLQVTNALVLGSIKACLEFMVIFKSLNYIEKGTWHYWTSCLVLLGFIPLKYSTIKKAVNKPFKANAKTN